MCRKQNDDFVANVLRKLSQFVFDAFGKGFHQQRMCSPAIDDAPFDSFRIVPKLLLPIKLTKSEIILRCENTSSCSVGKSNWNWNRMWRNSTVDIGKRSPPVPVHPFRFAVTYPRSMESHSENRRSVCVAPCSVTVYPIPCTAIHPECSSISTVATLHRFLCTSFGLPLFGVWLSTARVYCNRRDNITSVDNKT